MSSVARRVADLAESRLIEFEYQGSDENDIRAIAEVELIELTYSGSDENLLQELEAAIALLP